MASPGMESLKQVNEKQDDSNVEFCSKPSEQKRNVRSSSDKKRRSRSVSLDDERKSKRKSRKRGRSRSSSTSSERKRKSSHTSRKRGRSRSTSTSSERKRKSSHTSRKRGRSRSTSASAERKRKSPHTSRKRGRSNDRSRKRKKSKHRKRYRSESVSSASSSDDCRSKSRKHKRKREKKRKKKSKKSKSISAQNVAFGSRGIVRPEHYTEMQQEFDLWVREVKNCEIPGSKRDAMELFKEFAEDFNTVTLPHEKYYNLEKYEAEKMAKQMKKHAKQQSQVQIVFDDENLRKKEIAVEKERQRIKEAHEQLSRVDKSKALAMKEQDTLRLRMKYLYETGDTEGARKIQQRLKASSGGDMLQ